MSLRYHYLGPADLLNKLEREAARTWSAASDLRKDAMCDHFFNFCVTAHALRDWVGKSPEFPGNVDIHAICNAYPELQACREIANLNKHFSFEKIKKTRGVVVGRSKAVDVFENKDGEVYLSDPREIIEISIVIDGEPIRESNEFMGRVIKIWLAILNKYAIPFQSIHKDKQ